MKSFAHKTIVITGAASGIGRALATSFAGMGAKLALCDIDHTGLQETIRMLPASNQTPHISSVVDVSNKLEMLDFAKKVLQQLGPADVLINNAGVSLTINIDGMQRHDFNWLFATNFWGVVNGCEAFLPHLKSRNESHIVNMASVFGLVAIPGQAAYCASKFAVRGFSDALRLELLSSPVSVSAVYPGGVRTNIIRKGRHFLNPVGEEIDVRDLAIRFEKMARTSPEQAAASIINAIRKKKVRVLIGSDARIIDLLVRIFPSFVNRIVDAVLRRKMVVPGSLLPADRDTMQFAKHEQKSNVN